MYKILSLITGFILFLASLAISSEYRFKNNWGDDGFTITYLENNKIKINFSVGSFSIENKKVNNENFHEILLPNVFLPNKQGAPNLPGIGGYFAIPQGAKIDVDIINSLTETYENIDVLPAPQILPDNEREPLNYTRDELIYKKNSMYPASILKVSDQMEIRGINAALVGITPFQYNPVTRQLIVYKDVEIEISFSGGNGRYGDERLRSRWWDPILRDIFVNEVSIPDISYNKSFISKDITGCEYLIISPNDSIFTAWADSIKQFRTCQGIQTKVVTLDEIGSNTASDIQNYIDDAYNLWDIVPSACLLLGDYGTDENMNIISPVFDNYCVADNIYADVTGNHVPDIIFARITANNGNQLETMITKFINYERNPPDNPDFYDHPITALGWQTERWFQVCSESIGGFWKNTLGKNPVRINEIYEGNPNGDPWSTAFNTATVLNVFGPDGLGYIPSSPGEMDNWSNGNASMLNDAINNGAFMLQHRDHGNINGWGEPLYNSTNISGLTNTDLTYVFSINCQTGMFHSSGNCFAENFHRYKNDGLNSGALGILAATENSYSFVNDVFVWGIYDYFWPEFLPAFGSNPEYRGVMPAFGSAAGKYFLKQSSWPNMNSYYANVTNNLFHHHGDAFLCVYTEVPQELSVFHDNNLLDNQESFTVWADEDALIALTVDGVIIGSEMSSGGPVEINIPSQEVGDKLLVTVTKQNYYRHESTVDVISSDVPYVILESFDLNDALGNNNGLLDYNESVSLSLNMRNAGLQATENITLGLLSESPYITIADDFEQLESISAGDFFEVDDAFAFEVDKFVPDNTNIVFEILASDGNNNWSSQFYIKSHAFDLEYVNFEVFDPEGNNNGRLDPGENADINLSIKNSGSSEAYNVTVGLNVLSDYITVNSPVQSYGAIGENSSTTQSFNISLDASITEGQYLDFIISIHQDENMVQIDTLSLCIGRFNALVLDLDPNNYSGPGILESLNSLDITAHYLTEFPEDFSYYKNLFICLGIHNGNYELSKFRGQQLKDFLLSGRNIYMEGAVTWNEDIQTSVHPMFKISTVEDGIYFYEDILGINGSFTGALQFDYQGAIGANTYYIQSNGLAFDIFTTQDPFYGLAVANNAGAYKTIGSIFEFGQLTDGSFPSTKDELMQKYIDWFEGIITGENIDENLSKDSKRNVLSCSPNPFRTETTVNLNLTQDSNTTLQIMNMQGKIIRTLINNRIIQKGTSGIIWDKKDNRGKEVQSGIYFIYLTLGNDLHTFKLAVY